LTTTCASTGTDADARRKTQSRVSVQLFGDRSDPRLFVAKRKAKAKFGDPTRPSPESPHPTYKLYFLCPSILGYSVISYQVPGPPFFYLDIYIYIYYDEVSEEKIFYTLVFAVGGMPRGGWCHARRPSNLVPIYCSYHCPWWSYGYVCMLHVGRGGVILIRRKHQKEK
jgi:hypothetical protein